MEEPARSRRAVLRTLGLLLAGGAGLWRFLTPRRLPDGLAARTIAIAAADVPAGGAFVLPQEGVALVRDGRAILGIELACTHLGCTVKATPAGFACPCHGSRFSSRGDCVAGPAAHALRRLAVEERDGTVTITPGQLAAMPVASGKGEG